LCSFDSFITSKVKARFVDAKKFNAVYVKVVTESNVVYLMGLVTAAEADQAADDQRGHTQPRLKLRQHGDREPRRCSEQAGERGGSLVRVH
jgi:hypothetical protein